jgi:hypothetical protein
VFFRGNEKSNFASFQSGLCDAFLVHQFDGLAQLAETHPVQSRGLIFQVPGSFFFQRDHRHFDSLAARAFQHEKRESPVSGDKSPTFYICAGVRHGV